VHRLAISQTYEAGRDVLPQFRNQGTRL